LPQSCMSHQRREWFLLMSRNSQRQVALLHWWIRPVSSRVPGADRVLQSPPRVRCYANEDATGLVMRRD
jgi:hypothetical protein